MGLRDFLQRTVQSLMTPATLAGGGRGSVTGGWYPLAVVREPWTGAWQSNYEIAPDLALKYAPVFACSTLIATDIGKTRLRLVEQDEPGIWSEATNPAYSPVLRKPNHYQLPFQFVSYWQFSKLLHGNTYVLKERDKRGVVTALYVLDPRRVLPLVTPDGAVYYQLAVDPLAGIGVTDAGPALVVPASEIIHDRMYCLFHPLVGVSPLFAAAVSAIQGQTIQQTSNFFFANGSAPGGVILVPGAIDPVQAARLKEEWEKNFSGANVGRVAILSHDMKYEPTSINAVDAQLIDQLKWTAETICSVFHVPAYLVGVGPAPPYANIEPLVQQYYAQCLQSLFVSMEQSLDDGLELGAGYGTEFDIDDLIWMDQATRGKAAHDGIGAGALSPNEARKKYYGIGPVAGGDTPYMQQQYYSLAELAKRDGMAEPTPPAPSPDETSTPRSIPAGDVPTDGDASLVSYDAFRAALHKHCADRGLAA